MPTQNQTEEPLAPVTAGNELPNWLSDAGSTSVRDDAVFNQTNRSWLSDDLSTAIAPEQIAATPPPPIGSGVRVKQAAGSLVRGFGESIGGSLKGISLWGAAMENKHPGKMWDAGPANERYLYRLGEGIERLAGAVTPTPDERLKDSFLNTQFPSALGSGLSFLVGGGVVKAGVGGFRAALGTSAKTAAAAGASLEAHALARGASQAAAKRYAAKNVAARVAKGELMEAGVAITAMAVPSGFYQGYTDAEAHLMAKARAEGRDTLNSEELDQLFTSGLLNAGAAVSEAFPLARMLNRLNKYSNGTILNRLLTATKEGLEELLQETFQGASGNFIAANIVKYDEGRKWYEGLVEQGGAGGMTGFTLSLLTQAVGRHVHRARKAQALETAAENAEKNGSPAVATELRRQRDDVLNGVDQEAAPKQPTTATTDTTDTTATTATTDTTTSSEAIAKAKSLLGKSGFPQEPVNADAPVAEGAAGIKTPLGGLEADKGSVSATQTEGASALTPPNEAAAPTAVNPIIPKQPDEVPSGPLPPTAEVRPAAPQEQAMPAEVRPDAPAAAKAAVREQGAANTIIATGKPNGTRAIGHYDVIEAADLEKMLQKEIGDTQTRDRTNNKASQDQIEQIRQSPDPLKLAESPDSLGGAPSVDATAVLAGNGRAEGVIKAWQTNPNGAEKYRTGITAAAKRLGLGEKMAAMKQPVLIRRITGYENGDMGSFVVQSNPQKVGLGENTAEKALLDFGALEKGINNVIFTESGNLTQDSLHWVGMTLEKEQRGVTRDTKGNYDLAEATKRVQAAMLAGMAKQAGIKYSALSDLMESDHGKRALSSILSKAGKLAVLDADISLANAIVDALREFQLGLAAVKRGDYGDISAWYANRGRELFVETLSPDAQRLLDVFVKTIRSARPLNNLLDGYIELARREQNERDTAAGTASFFGDERSKASPSDLLRKIVADSEAEAERDIFAGQGGEKGGNQVASGRDSQPVGQAVPQPQQPTPSEPAADNTITRNGVTFVDEGGHARTPAGQRAVDAIAAALPAAIKKLGLMIGDFRIVLTSGFPSGSSGVASGAANGQLDQILVDAALLVKSLDSRRFDLTVALSEELIHNIDGAALFDQWVALPKEGRPAFPAFYRQTYAAVYAGMTPLERAVIEKRYWGRRLTAEELAKPDTQVAVAAEYVRYILQRESTGTSTEANYKRNTALLKLLEWLREFYAKAFGGVPASAGVRHRLDAVNARLKRSGIKAATSTGKNVKGQKLHAAGPEQLDLFGATAARARTEVSRFAPTRTIRPANDVTAATDEDEGAGVGEMWQEQADVDVLLPDSAHKALDRALTDVLTDQGGGLTETQIDEARSYIISRAYNELRALHKTGGIGEVRFAYSKRVEQLLKNYREWIGSRSRERGGTASTATKRAAKLPVKGPAQDLGQQAERFKAEAEVAQGRYSVASLDAEVSDEGADKSTLGDILEGVLDESDLHQDMGESERSSLKRARVQDAIDSLPPQFRDILNAELEGRAGTRAYREAGGDMPKSTFHDRKKEAVTALVEEFARRGWLRWPKLAGGFAIDGPPSKAERGELLYAAGVEETPRELSPLGFYDTIVGALRQWQPKGTPEQLMAHLGKTRGALEQAEWIGLDGFLKGKTTVTRAEVEQFTRDNAVEIKEVVKGGDGGLVVEQTPAGNWIVKNRHGVAIVTENAFGEPIGTAELAKRLAIQWSDRGKFSQWQLPGGENYRELLLTLPLKEPDGFVAFQKDGGWAIRFPDNSVKDGFRTREDAVWSLLPSYSTFINGHFAAPNLLAHVRFNERTDAQGRRALFIEEVQSDWHMEGRKHGYRGAEADTTGKLAAINARMNAARNTVSDLQTREMMGRTGPHREYAAIEALQDNQEWLAANRELEAVGKELTAFSNVVPDAPFKGTWPMLVMKRMLRWAAENNFDSVAWITGDQTADRYDLSKQVDAINVSRGGGKTWEIWADKDGRQAINRNVETLAEVEAIIGKELTAKVADMAPGDAAKTFSGLDLKIGGEWARALYDRTLPNEVNKFVKKYGARVGTTQLEGVVTGVTEKGYTLTRSRTGASWNVNEIKVDPEYVGDGSGGIVGAVVKGGFASEQEAREWADKNIKKPSVTVHSLTLTPDLKDAALGGMPLFAAAPESDLSDPNQPADRALAEMTQSAVEMQQAQMVLGIGPDAPVALPRMERGWRAILRRLTSPGQLWAYADWLDSVGLKGLSDRLRLYYDTEARVLGDLVAGYNAIQRRVTRKQFEKGREEAEQYITLREQGFRTTNREDFLAKAQQFKATASAAGRELIDWQEATAELTGTMSGLLNIHALTPEGKWRPAVNMGREHFPRMFKAQVWGIIKDRTTPEGRAHWRRMVQELKTHYTQIGTPLTDAEAEAMLEKQFSLYKGGDFFGNMELARGQRLPDHWYDTSLDGYLHFVQRFADRAAQISAFGQKRTGQNKDAWEVAIELATKSEGSGSNLVKRLAQGRAVVLKEGMKLDGFTSALIETGVPMASAIYLSAPLTAMRNLVSAIRVNTETLGVGHTLAGTGAALKDAAQAAFKTASNVMRGDFRVVGMNLIAEAEAIGALRHDIVMGQILDTNSDPDLPPAKGNRKERFVRVALFMQSASERAARAITYSAASHWLRATRALAGADPLAASHALRVRLAALQRMGFAGADLEALLSGDLATTNRFYRSAVAEKQYAYNLTQHPLFLSASLPARVFFQFQKYSYQRSRDLARNVLGPVVHPQEITLPDGTKAKVRDWWPMLRYALLAAGAGELYALLRELLTDRERKEAQLLEIVRTAEAGEGGRALELAGERLIKDIVLDGGFGVIGDYAMLAKDAATRGTRYRDPFRPPSLQWVQEVLSAANKLQQRYDKDASAEHNLESAKAWLVRDLHDSLMTVPWYAQVPAGVGSKLAQATLSDSETAKLAVAKKELSRVRVLARRFADERGYDVDAVMGRVQPVKTPRSATYEDINEALLIGDTKAAIAARDRLLAEEMAQAKEAGKPAGMARQKALLAMKASVRSRTPIKVPGAEGSDAKVRAEFLRWVKERSPDDAGGIEAMHRRYEQSARMSGVM